MKPLEAPVRALVEQWLAKADIDFRTAARLLSDDDRIRESIAFHCQQAAEKYLKALLVALHQEFGKTHSLSRLLDLLATQDPQTADSLARIDLLTPFGVEIRYPGELPELLPGEEEELFALAQHAKDEIMAALQGALSFAPADAAPTAPEIAANDLSSQPPPPSTE